jgi:hypothetical protein
VRRSWGGISGGGYLCVWSPSTDDSLRWCAHVFFTNGLSLTNSGNTFFSHIFQLIFSCIFIQLHQSLLYFYLPKAIFGGQQMKKENISDVPSTISTTIQTVDDLTSSQQNSAANPFASSQSRASQINGVSR